MKKLAYLAVMALAACTKPAGGPLSHTIDNTRIAAVALDAKKPVTEAQQAHDLAQLQHARAEEEYRDSEIEQEIAEYQAEHAVLVSQLVASKMMPNAPAISAEAAALARKTAAAKYAFMEARRSWLGALASSTFYGVYAAQAKLELEKAKVAQANNAVPAGFDIAAYEKQADARAKAASEASVTTDKERASAEAKLGTWAELERGFMKAAGLEGPAESDRVKSDWQQVLATPAPATTSASATAPAPTQSTP